MIRSLTIWHVKAVCHQCHERKLGVTEFIKAMEAEFKHVSDFMTEIELAPEIKMLEMARRYQKCYDPQAKPIKRPKMKETTEEGEEKAPAAPVEEDPNEKRVLTLEDVEIIIDKGASKMPFSIDKKIADALKKQVDLYNKTLKKESEKLFEVVPSIDEFEPLL